MTDEELDGRFDHHPPTSQHIVRQHETVRECCKTLAVLFDGILIDGREKALALTKVEEAMFWANAAIARHQ